jgi:hypothetical protein
MPTVSLPGRAHYCGSGFFSRDWPAANADGKRDGASIVVSRQQAVRLIGAMQSTGLRVAGVFGPMSPPVWRDLPTRPCPRCGAPLPITQRIVEPRAVDWRPCASVRVVNWCGHAEELLPSPWGLLTVMEAPGY